MTINFKLFVSSLVVFLALGVTLIDSNSNNAGPHWLWRGGENDGLRNLLMQKDGRLRRFTKVFILLFFAIFLLVIWLVVPGAK